MNLENGQRVSAVSEIACIAVLQKPGDAGARKRLFQALAALIDPTFQGEEADDYYSSQLTSRGPGLGRHCAHPHSTCS
jgi:hypothetical protein